VTAQPEAAEPAYLAPAEAPPTATPADQRLEQLVRDRFAAVVKRYPVLATYLGIDEYDGELADGSRDAALADVNDAREFVSKLEQIDDTELSPYYAMERELALFATRRQVFDDDVHRLWERRVTASDEVGDGIFLVFARGRQPLAERLGAIASRLEHAPEHIEQQKSRLDGSQAPMRLWNELELDAITALPTLFSDVLAAAREEVGSDHPDVRRIEGAAPKASAALASYAGWIRDQLADASDEFALGPDRYDELVSLRAFDDLDTDQILAIGEEQLAFNRERRRRVAREIDSQADERDVVDRVKSANPPNFEAALDAYRAAMRDARAFVIDHDIASIPEGEQISVVETPRYLRNALPFAAYFTPPKFGSGGSARGLYVVTPSVNDDDAGAMREHNYASIYNTSIHEAYPGHHLQLTAAITHPSLVRLLVDAPEFVEGWAMYSEEMMREEGFDTDPEHLLMMYTDTIWRACRIILDIKLHRGDITIDEATDFMVEQTGFERANAAAEVQWYTYRPTYPLSYLLGKVLLLRLRDDEKRRLGDRFSLLRFHDALLREGSLPISFHRRLMARSDA
jgi:uncharacterized protein (DUF885 family)